jgi:hypothetical protein
MSGFLAETADLQVETAEILALEACSPFSELGFSLTLAPWFTQSGAFTRHSLVFRTLASDTGKRQVDRLKVKLMKKAPH